MKAQGIRILAISGSIRKASLNTSLLRTMQEIAPERITIDLYEELSEIPPYDDDVRSAGFPPPVHSLREQVRRADALIFATPEYNRSFSGVLKNAIDWVSRPPDQPFKGKPAFVTGAGPGALGTALANYQLRQVLSVIGVHVMPGLEVLVGGAADKFNPEGGMMHEATRAALLKALLELRLLAKITGELSAQI